MHEFMHDIILSSEAYFTPKQMIIYKEGTILVDFVLDFYWTCFFWWYVFPSHMFEGEVRGKSRPSQVMLLLNLISAQH